MLWDVLAQTSTPSATQVPSATEVGQVTNTIWFATLGFGAFALVLVGIVQFVIGKNNKGEATTFVPFARTYGLIVIATLAAALTLSSIDLDSKTGAFALLGTIAGYLAATATGVTKDGPRGPGGPDGGEPTGGSGGRAGDDEATQERPAGKAHETEGPGHRRREPSSDPRRESII